LYLEALAAIALSLSLLMAGAHTGGSEWGVSHYRMKAV
jgi:hypothetical protein